MQLDPRSLIAMAGFMSTVMSIVLLLMRRSYPRSVRGLGNWGCAPLLWTASSVLLSGRGVLPDWLSMVVANQLLLLGTLLFYIGTRRFLGQPGGWRTWGTVLALSTALHLAMLHAEASYTARLTVFTLVNASLYLSFLRFLAHHGGNRFPVRLVQVSLAVHTMALVMRLGALWGDVGTADLMSPSLFQTLHVGAYTLMVLMLPIGAILMATDHLRTELEHQATHDALTRTLNRRALLQLCEDELERSRRHGQGPALMMMDLDNFKAINDTHGHQHGDAVLAHFAQCTRSVLRRPDRLGRYGGEEFLVLLPHTTAGAALPVAARIHAALGTGHALDCQVSIGVTGWLGPDDTLDAMLSRADAALYRAKHGGRNQTQRG